MKKRAFTLIELLVVIAIIAILAAILFPVFAQAKRAAKGAVALSGAKQMCLAQLMYTNDSDDMISPVVEFDANWNVLPFSYLQQPYMKSWSILIDPTGPTIGSGETGSGSTGDEFALYGLWGMGPRAQDMVGNAFYGPHYTFGNHTAAGALMTGGKTWVYDGIAGVANINKLVIWSQAGYNYGSTPSLTTSAIASPADEVMLAQAGNYDFMWQENGADQFGLVYSSAPANTYGLENTASAPLARARDNDGASVGFNSLPFFTPNPAEPTGLVIWTGTDGHAKSTPWRQLMGTTVATSSGQLAIKAFWPSGS
ncbi:MAG: prepilin-type N-terminal cleavage/methylation domain-containing protein [Fimbriimonadaceae bacterium]